jgi:hypothetical protein
MKLLNLDRRNTTQCFAVTGTVQCNYHRTNRFESHHTVRPQTSEKSNFFRLLTRDISEPKQPNQKIFGRIEELAYAVSHTIKMINIRHIEKMLRLGVF